MCHRGCRSEWADAGPRTGIGRDPRCGAGSDAGPQSRCGAPTALSAKGFGSWIIAVCTAPLAGKAEPPLPAPRAMFAAFPLDLALVAEPAALPAPGSATQAGPATCGPGRRIRRRYSLGSRPHRVRSGRGRRQRGVTGPDGDIELRAQVPGRSRRRHQPDPQVGRYGFPRDVVERRGRPARIRRAAAQEWIDPVGGGWTSPGSAASRTLGFHRAERRRLRLRCAGAAAAAIRSSNWTARPREATAAEDGDDAAHEPGRIRGQPQPGARR